MCLGYTQQMSACRTDSSMRRVLRSLMQSIMHECDSEFGEAKLAFRETIREHLVSPVLQKVYKDLFPYVCALVVVLTVILVFVLLLGNVMLPAIM